LSRALSGIFEKSQHRLETSPGMPLTALPRPYRAFAYSGQVTVRRVQSGMDQKEKLRQHFARRVTNQARLVLELGRVMTQQPEKNQTLCVELLAASERLVRHAERFEMDRLGVLGRKVAEAAGALPREGVPSPEALQNLASSLKELASSIRRRADQNPSQTPGRFRTAPIVIALEDQPLARRLLRHLDDFGFRAAITDSPDIFIEDYQAHHPRLLLMDVNFGGREGGGLETVEKLNQQSQPLFPVIFFSSEDNSLPTRLRASRCGGEMYLYPDMDSGLLIETIESLSRGRSEDPFRVLVVDDSRSQARFMENILDRAGMIARVVTDPMETLNALADFEPDIIVMDMYMPDCTGMEIARVIRQQQRYLQVPIVYLSGEEDVGKQIQALGQGGEDFLTKPVEPRQLVATLNLRGRRGRAQAERNLRDPLTNLLNHTQARLALDRAVVTAEQDQTRLSLAVICVDRLTAINQNHGPVAGDRALKNLAVMLRQRLRKSDIIGRFDGSRLLLILPDSSLGDARRVIDELRERYSELHQQAGDAAFNATLSGGVASHDIDDSASELLGRALTALRQAKEAGGNATRTLDQYDQNPESSGKVQENHR